MKGIELHKENLIDALDCVTWYNGLAEEIVHWKDPGYFDERTNSLGWDWYRFNDFPLETREQLEVIWIICVRLFGNYGTSPRSGWIENIEAFYEFVDEITKTYREVREYERDLMRINEKKEE